MLSYETRTQRIRELSGHECLALLRSAGAGRIAYEDAEGPVVHPVNHVIDNGTVVLRTSAAGQLARLTRRDRVAYEVDDLEPQGEASWSVLVRGSVRFMEADEVSALVTRPEPQAEGVRTLFLRLTPRAITGRRLVPVE